MSEINKSVSNINYNNEPYRMSDARSFTDYRPRHEQDNELRNVICDANNKCCNSSNDNDKFRVCMINNTDTVKGYLLNDNFKGNYASV